MFTGLVQAVGQIRGVTPEGTGRRIEIDAPWTDLDIGESVACDGVCLTVFSQQGGAFQVIAGEETLRRTTMKDLAPGSRIHLERALRLSDRLGGHLVQGHVDGIAIVRSAERTESFCKLDIVPPPGLLRFFVEKGSVTVDGVSLTVNELGTDGFSVGIIPHTLAVTKLGTLRSGSAVNIEVDVLAKYVERLFRPRE